MGTEGKKIVDLDVDNLIKELNKALADEWLAFYQYWVGARVIKGPARGAVEAELNEHAEEELEHAEMLVERIIQLGGTPILKPTKWYDKTNCGYEAPTDHKIKPVLKQNIKGEQCAIRVYQKLMDKTMGKDHVTYNLIDDILEDEVEHEEDLQALLEDFEMM